jgi:hypothetical protein
MTGRSCAESPPHETPHNADSYHHMTQLSLTGLIPTPDYSYNTVCCLIYWQAHHIKQLQASLQYLHTHIMIVCVYLGSREAQFGEKISHFKAVYLPRRVRVKSPEYRVQLTDSDAGIAVSSPHTHTHTHTHTDTHTHSLSHTQHTLNNTSNSKTRDRSTDV